MLQAARSSVESIADGHGAVQLPPHNENRNIGKPSTQNPLNAARIACAATATTAVDDTQNNNRHKAEASKQHRQQHEERRQHIFWNLLKSGFSLSRRRFDGVDAQNP